MLRVFDRRLGAETMVIGPGEQWASTESLVVATCLGSCVAVCLRDEARGVAGMNHFMLPSPLPRSHFFSTDEGRFGIYAMEMLVNDLLGLGAARSRLAAKVFGGGNVLKLSSEAGGRIGDSNVLFAREFLGAEGIPIVAQDTGGTRGRKILFDTRTGDVWVRKLKGDAFAAVLEAEEAYGDSRRAGESGGVTLFVAPPQRR